MLHNVIIMVKVVFCLNKQDGVNDVSAFKFHLF